MKAHLAKRFSNHKVSLSQSECGQYHGSRNAYILKTKAFNEMYVNSNDTCCMKCVKAAIDQKRFIVEKWAFPGVFHNGFIHGMHYTKQSVLEDIKHAKAGIELGFMPPENYQKGLAACQRFLAQK